MSRQNTVRIIRDIKTAMRQ